ncbi:MAG: hypothetical protein EOO77_24405, partial [Oxalobacteraceae bacterium]
MLDRRTFRGAALRVGWRASQFAGRKKERTPRFALYKGWTQSFVGSAPLADPSAISNTASGTAREPRLPRYVAGPKAVIVLLVLAVTLCLGTLIYVQHANSIIVDHDMQTAVKFSEIAARFDHEDGNLYRLLVDASANGRAANSGKRLDDIRRRISQIGTDLAG